ncbi:hypothetical protein V6Z11_A11G122700 [Gossypium hirsutum]
MNILQQSEFKETNKRCVDCSTTRTPLWRGGPAGPRSLCNACGIRYRKKNRALLGLNRESRSEKSKRGIEVRRSGIKLKSFGREQQELRGIGIAAKETPADPTIHSKLWMARLVGYRNFNGTPGLMFKYVG